MNELAMVTGGLEVMAEPEAFTGSGPINNKEVGIPRGGKLMVRV